jgi:hypothetical protein
MRQSTKQAGIHELILDQQNHLGQQGHEGCIPAPKAPGVLAPGVPKGLAGAAPNAGAAAAAGAPPAAALFTPA